MARILRTARPSKLTLADHARMARAVALADAKRERAAMWERIAKRCVFAGVLILGITLFYGVTR